MKLIYYMTLIVWLVETSSSQKFNQEQYSFPPQFKPPNTGVFGSDSSIYLPPESHTTVPYFQLNNGNKLPFQFLPPTVTKVPSAYPTPFPMIMSSTMISRRNEDDDDDDEEEITKNRVPQVTPPNLRMRNNQTSKNIEQTQDMRPAPKMYNNFQSPIDRIDAKYSPTFHNVSPKTPVSQTPSSQRRMIISSEILKNDHPDQLKRASILGPQLIQSPIAYYSTTEPAIPILRLSNEMDLDGSFSYEALGADQTHYVQHSRMENSGTDKEEQVVEGSYSYVGDNGQTYTVHYVADSNGYRASGDHLPVPPPVPEIIQRAVQYNLAEEAKKPPHLREWQDNEKLYESNENERHRFSITPQRNLFTGRTPEAFSFGLTQNSVLQNNLPAADNSQVPVKTNFDFSTDQSKGKNNNSPIAPQITFLASQGAHNPSVNSHNSQQQISRIFASEKPTLPQLMNYEASSPEPDLENNKALWRWQYGLNANAANENQHPNKNSISRSSGEGDDVIINFNNMSPEQYTKLMKDEFIDQNTEIPVNQRESINAESYNAEQQILNDQKNQKSYLSSTQQNENTKPNDQNPIYKEIISPSFHNKQPAENTEYSYSTVSNKESENLMLDSNSNSYITSAPLTTQSYEYSDTPYESTKLKTQGFHITSESSNIFNDNYSKNVKDNFSINNFATATRTLNNAVNPTENGMLNQKNDIQFIDFIQKEEKSFKPIVSINLEKESSQETTTAEPNPESILRDNYFLKHLFKSESSHVNKKPEKADETITMAPQNQQQSSNKINLEPKFDKLPKFIPYQSKPQNEIKDVIKKPLDMTDVLNYITFKNHFESSKLKSKNKFSSPDKFSQRLERPQIFIPLENDREEHEQLDQQETQNLRSLNNQKQQELRGIIKNYKVLQRNNNLRNMEQNRNQFMTDAAQRHLKTMQTQNLPPLGRAGPSMKSYLPPTYL